MIKFPPKYFILQDFSFQGYHSSSLNKSHLKRLKPTIKGFFVCLIGQSLWWVFPWCHLALLLSHIIKKSQMSYTVVFCWNVLSLTGKVIPTFPVKTTNIPQHYSTELPVQRVVWNWIIKGANWLWTSSRNESWTCLPVEDTLWIPSGLGTPLDLPGGAGRRHWEEGCQEFLPSLPQTNTGSRKSQSQKDGWPHKNEYYQHSVKKKQPCWCFVNCGNLLRLVC